MRSSFLTTSRIFALLALLGYLSVALFGFMHLSHMVPMNGSALCPYMTGEHALCEITITTYLHALQLFSSATFSSLHIDVLLGLVCIVGIFWYRPPRTVSCFKQQLIPIDVYQELFSNGILHPKAP